MGGVSVYENLLYKGTIVYACLECRHEEIIQTNYEYDDLIGSINKSYLTINPKEETIDPLEDDEAQIMIEKLDILVGEIQAINSKKEQAESIYNRLRQSGRKIRDLPWHKRRLAHNSTF